MSYLLLLLVVWKPIYCLVMSFVKHDKSYFVQAKTWLGDLVNLVNPFTMSY